jgi:hypothetical protein
LVISITIAFALWKDARVISLPPKMGLDNVPSILGLHNQSKLLRFLLVEVDHLHVIFDLNGVLVAKWALCSCM